MPETDLEPPRRPVDCDEPPTSVRDVDPAEFLSLLGDEYTQAILSTLGDDSMCAREIAETADVSCATVYRRLNRLVAAGVIETEMGIHGSGHHRKQFRISVDELEIRLDGALHVAADDNTC
jgi:predicted transcriptional regulator